MNIATIVVCFVNGEDHMKYNNKLEMVAEDEDDDGKLRIDLHFSSDDY